MKEILDVIIHIQFNEDIPLDMLLTKSKNLQREKWDWVLPENLLYKNYASLYLNLNEAKKWLEGFIKSTPSSETTQKHIAP